MLEGKPLDVLSYLYGCWKVCQGGRSLNAPRKLQSAHREWLPLEVRKVTSSLGASALESRGVKTLASQ